MLKISTIPLASRRSYKAAPERLASDVLLNSFNFRRKCRRFVLKIHINPRVEMFLVSIFLTTGGSNLGLMEIPTYVEEIV